MMEMLMLMLMMMMRRRAGRPASIAFNRFLIGLNNILMCFNQS
jgi:hypothetical protein